MKLNQKRTPMLNTLLRHARKKMISFHTPGHKNGYGVEKELLDFVGKNFFYMDVTVSHEVDSLHDPRGPLREAQRLMADAYGVKESFFLVNGSTVGNQAMFLSACNPNDSIILSRNIHKSAMSGIILSGVWPIWIQPTVDRKLDIIMDSSPEQIEDALKKFPEAVAVFITSPTYNGVCNNVQKIVDIVHKHDKLLLVDEAWGPHLKFHPDLPKSAVECGADMVVHSVHKILSAMSQGSVLHLNSDSVDPDRVRKVVSLLQTTSPSYPVMASLDLARKQMAIKGERIIERMLKNAEYGRRNINKLDNMSCFTESHLNPDCTLDPTKLTINVKRLGLSGYEVDKLLNKKYNIQVDCSDLFNLIAILGVGTSRYDIKKLVDSLSEIDVKFGGKLLGWEFKIPSLSTEMVYIPRDIILKLSYEEIPLKDSVGYISAETLSPYPPGIPILIPGERITTEIVNYLTELNSSGVQLPGREKRRFEKIKVAKFETGGTE